MYLLTQHKKLIIPAILLALFISTLYFSWDTLSATLINQTITSRPTLETGLVGHWTFDGGDMLLSSSTAEVRDRSGQGNHGDWTGADATQKQQLKPGIIGQAMNLMGWMITF